MRRVMIYGSCVTRDSVAFWDKNQLELASYVARQPLVSALSPVDTEPFRLKRVTSTFQKRMALGDITGSLRQMILESRPDLIVWDLCDERLGFRRAPGGYVGGIRDYEKEGIYVGPKLGRPIDFGSTEHFDLWSDKLAQFTLFLEENDLRGRTFVNTTPWGARNETGVPDESTRAAEIFNAKVIRYYEAIQDKGIQSLSAVPDSVCARKEGHQWGYAPFHYQDETYRSMAAAILRASESVARTFAGPLAAL